MSTTNVSLQVSELTIPFSFKAKEQELELKGTKITSCFLSENKERVITSINSTLICIKRFTNRRLCVSLDKYDTKTVSSFLHLSLINLEGDVRVRGCDIATHAAN